MPGYAESGDPAWRRMPAPWNFRCNKDFLENQNSTMNFAALNLLKRALQWQ